jgi:hypothetical protein
MKTDNRVKEPPSSIELPEVLVGSVPPFGITLFISLLIHCSKFFFFVQLEVRRRKYAKHSLFGSFIFTLSFHVRFKLNLNREEIKVLVPNVEVYGKKCELRSSPKNC